MMNKHWLWLLGMIVFAAYGAYASASEPVPHVSLANVERVALSQSPELAHIVSQQSASLDASIADGQLQDPKLHLGLLNVPTDNFQFNQNNMTQMRVGISQDFPRGNTLKFAAEAQQWTATAQGFQLQNTKAAIIKDVRLAWIELAYLLAAKKILLAHEQVLQKLVDATTAKLASGLGYQHDVYKSQMLLSEVAQLILQNQVATEQTRAQLSRWLGPAMASRCHPDGFPVWPKPMDQQSLLHVLKQHPSLQAMQSQIKSAQAKVNQRKEGVRPARSAGIYYAFRQGKDAMNDQSRSDFVGLQFSTELPFFTANRQQRQISASIKQYQAAEYQYRTDYLDLKKQVDQDYAAYQSLQQQISLFQTESMQQAKQYAASTKSAYANTQVAFDTVANAYAEMLQTSLQYLFVQARATEIRARIYYLESQI